MPDMRQEELEAEVERLTTEVSDMRKQFADMNAHYGGQADEIEKLTDEIRQLRHRQFHYLWMLEEVGIDSSAAKSSECALGDDCPYFSAADKQALSYSEAMQIDADCYEAERKR